MRVYVEGDHLVLAEVARAELETVRALPSRSWHAASNTWRAPHVQETWDHLTAAGVDLAGRGIPRPKTTGYTVDADGPLFRLTLPVSPENRRKAQAIPEYRMHDARTGAWLCKATKANAEYIRTAFPAADWTSAAKALAQAAGVALALALAVPQRPLAPRETPATVQVAVADDFAFHTAPYAHQRRAFHRSRDAGAFMLSMEQGTGKSKVFIDTAVWNWERGRINAVALVTGLEALKSNWAYDEIPTHCPPRVNPDVVIYQSDATAAQRREVDRFLTTQDPTCLRIFVINVEAVRSEKGRQALETFLKSHRVLLGMDESSKIKSPKALQTKVLLKLARFAVMRRTLTGTPATQSPLDAWAQYQFLDPAIIGIPSFYVARQKYAVMGGFNGREVLGFRNMDEFKARLDPHTFRVLKAECLDLPPKVYRRVTVDLTAEQRRLYNAMRDQMVAEFQGSTVSAAIVLTKLLRLAQITGGFVPTDDGAVLAVSGPNPKLEALSALVAERDGRKAIVWARFRAEIDVIARSLRATYGDAAVVEFHGGLDPDARTASRTRFQTDPAVRFFVGQTETGGVGITLTAASVVVYYSNSFSLESRLQSEDRAHRIGQARDVEVIDLVARDTLDTHVLGALRSKQHLANLITGDTVREWV